MPSISFATGSAPTEYDILGYVAKDARNLRECHVFFCGDTAPDVMATVGQVRPQHPALGRHTACTLPWAPNEHAERSCLSLPWAP